MLDLTRLDKQTVAKALDFSILPKETREADVRQGCAVTRQYGFAAFYTSSAYWTPVVKQELAGLDDVEIGVGIAFPFGSAPAAVKAFETEDAVRRGCTTVDLVINVGALKDKDYRAVQEELRLFVKAAAGAVTNPTPTTGTPRLSVTRPRIAQLYTRVTASALAGQASRFWARSRARTRKRCWTPAAPVNTADVPVVAICQSVQAPLPLRTWTS